MFEEWTRPNKQNKRYWAEEDRERVNQDIYLEMLQTVLWPKVRSVSQRRQYYFQQDGARCHTRSSPVRQTDRPWPAHSPDLAPNHFWLWGLCLQEIQRVKPRTMEGIKELVTNFCGSLDREDVIAATASIRKRAKECVKARGGHFEFRLKKKTRGVFER